MTDQTVHLTADERAALDGLTRHLAGRRYAEVDHHNDLRAEVRVRHISHQYERAHQNGSGTVLAVTCRRRSPWEAVHQVPDVEVVVLWDGFQPQHSPRISNVAHYHVEVVAA